jgi:hypothetical protein
MGYLLILRTLSSHQGESPGDVSSLDLLLIFQQVKEPNVGELPLTWSAWCEAALSVARRKSAMFRMG